VSERGLSSGKKKTSVREERPLSRLGKYPAASLARHAQVAGKIRKKRLLSGHQPWLTGLPGDTIIERTNMRRVHVKGFRLAVGLLFVVLLPGMVMMGCDEINETINPSDSHNLGGLWDVRITFTEGLVENWVFNIVQDGDSLSGTSTRADGSDSVAITGTVSDDTVEIIEQWGNPNFLYAGAIQSDSSMNGSCMYVDGTWPGSWVGTKR
jgi:hypothetical protein